MDLTYCWEIIQVLKEKCAFVKKKVQVFWQGNKKLKRKENVHFLKYLLVICSCRPLILSKKESEWKRREVALQIEFKKLKEA
jgi:hypothetical protein